MSSNKGFTLLELAIVMAIIGVIAAGGLVVLLASTATQQTNLTLSRFEQIDKALLNYSASFNRLPCPSDITLGYTSSNYGVEAANSGTCTGGTPAATTASSAGTVEGGLPTRALQLPDDYMYDGWGRRIRYAVDPAYTAANSLPIRVGGACTASTKGITVKDATGTARTTAAIYALVSHGKDGHGGYTKNSTIFNAGSTNPDEQTNCHCDSSTAGTTYTANYVQKLPTFDSTSALNTFDDLVSYKEAWQMQTPNSVLAAATSCGYVYVVDQGNNRIQKFSSSGSYISSPGSTGVYTEFLALNSAGLLFVQDFSGGTVIEEQSNGTVIQNINISSAPEQVFIDKNDNLWIADGNNHRVLKYTISGATSTLAQVIPASCASSCSQSNADGFFVYPEGIFVDSSGNVWVTDYNGYSVQKFNSAGTFQLKIGNSTSGSANGQFAGANSVAVDGSGNVWVVDADNNRVQKFNSSGVYQSQLGCATGGCSTGTANGQFSLPTIISIDSSGYLWITDNGNNRVQKFDSNGVYQSQLGCATGSCSSGSATGQFNSPNGVATSSQ